MKRVRFTPPSLRTLSLLTALALGACDEGALVRIEADFTIASEEATHTHVVGQASQFFVTLQNLAAVPLRIDVLVELDDDALASAIATPPRIEVAGDGSARVQIQVAGHRAGETRIVVRGVSEGLEREVGIALMVEEACTERDACDDGNACTTNDVCSGNACVGEAVTCPAPASLCEIAVCDADVGCVVIDSPNVCDDNNPCTDDTCDDVLGCRHFPVAAGTPCGERDGCLTWSFCAQTECVAQPVPDGAPCDDADACSSNDRCEGQVCQGTPSESPGAILQTVFNFGTRGATFTAIDDEHFLVVDPSTTGKGATLSVVRREDTTLTLLQQWHDETRVVVQPAPVAMGDGTFLLFRDVEDAETGLEHRVEQWWASPTELTLLGQAAVDYNSTAPSVVFVPERHAAYLLWLSRYDEHGFAGLTPISSTPAVGLNVWPAIELVGSPQGLGINGGDLLVRTRTAPMASARYGSTYRLDLADPYQPVVVQETNEENFYFGRDCYAITDDFIIGGRVDNGIGANGIVLREASGYHALIHEDLTDGSFEGLGCFHLGGNWAASLTFTSYDANLVTFSLFNFDEKTDGPVLTRDISARPLASVSPGLTVTGTSDVFAIASTMAAYPDAAQVFSRSGTTLVPLSGARLGEWGRLAQQGNDMWSYQSRSARPIVGASAISMIGEMTLLPRRSDVIVHGQVGFATGWRRAFERYDNIELSVSVISADMAQSVALGDGTLAATASGNRLYTLDVAEDGAVSVGTRALAAVGNMNLTGEVFVSGDGPDSFAHRARMVVSEDGQRVVAAYAFAFSTAHLVIIDIDDQNESTAAFVDIESPFELTVLDDGRVGVQTRGDLWVATVSDGVVEMELAGEVPWMADAVGAVGDDLFLGDSDGLHRVDLTGTRPTSTLPLPDRPHSLLSLDGGNLLVSTPTALLVVEPPCAALP